MNSRCVRRSVGKSSAFTSKTRCGELWYISPPTTFITAIATGGLKHLYDDIRSKHQKASDSEKKEESNWSYTDVAGHFNPTPGMPLMAQRYRFVEILAHGHTSVVVRVKDTLHENQVKIIKVLHVQYYLIGGQEADILTEINAADAREIFPIIRLRNLFRLETHYCLVFDAYNHFPLHCHFSQRCWIQEKSLKGIMLIASRLLSALHFLHKQNIIHADVKPENLLMLEDESVSIDIRVTDFGNSIRCTAEEIGLYEEDYELQTLLYRAPEVLLGVNIGLSIDLWSVGCILAELYLGKPLFQGGTKTEVLASMVDILGPLPREFVTGKFGQEYEQFLGDTPSHQEMIQSLRTGLGCVNFEFLQLLSGLLRYKPEDRLTSLDAIRSPFLAHFYPFNYLSDSNDKDSCPAPEAVASSGTENNSIESMKSLPGLKKTCFQITKEYSLKKPIKNRQLATRKTRHTSKNVTAPRATHHPLTFDFL